MKKPKTCYAPLYDQAVWWLRVMNYIRTIPGTIYSEQLIELTDCFDCPPELARRLRNDPEMRDLTDFMNEAEAAHETGLLKAYDGDFLKKDPVTGGVFTIPASREILDGAIWKLYKENSFPEPALNFNKYLYEPAPECDEKFVYEFPEIITEKEIDPLRKNGFLEIDDEREEVSFHFDVFRKPGQYYIYVRNFELSRILSLFDGYAVGSIFADKTVFLGHTIMSSMNDLTNNRRINGSLHFNCASFENDIEFNYTSFLCEDVPDGKVIDFRDACFFGSILFRNSVFGGTASNMEISFEDAKIYGTLDINNVDMGSLTLNCFQTIFDIKSSDTAEKASYYSKVNVVNTVFGGDSSIHFSDAEFRSELRSRVCLRNISNMPITKLNFASSEDKSCRGRMLCPHVYLMIDNCEIQNTLCIGNVRQLSFHHSQNYSRIVASEQWGEFPGVPAGERFRLFFGFDGNDIYPRKKTRGIGRTKIVNKLLLAVYNNDLTEDFGSRKELACSKGTDFLMLKENFSSQGLYDSEDVAFILFMEYKPRMDVKNKSDSRLRLFINTILYKLLYAAGKYGLSPTRVIGAAAMMVLCFTVVFFFMYISGHEDAFSTGSTLMAWDKLSSSYIDTLGDGTGVSLLKSFLYSLENVVPFVSQFEAIDLKVCFLTALENFLGSFLIGYFSVAVMRKILK